MKQNASPGELSEALRRRWKPEQEQHQGPENQDSQHMLAQPRGSLPEISATIVSNGRCSTPSALYRNIGRNAPWMWRPSAGHRCLPVNTLIFLSLFLEFLAFCSCKEFLAVLSVFHFFPKDFRGLHGKKNLASSVVFLALY